jgi:O-antigen/teichoic acid export membrane protein
VVFTIAAAATLLAREFAALVGLQAIALLAVVAWDLGLTAITTREIAAGHIDLASARSRLVRLRLETLPLGIASFAFGIWLLSRAIAPDTLVVSLVAILALLIGVDVLLIAVLEGQMDFRSSSLATTLGRWTAVLAMAGVLLIPGQALAAVVTALCLGEVMAIVVALVSIRRRRPPTRRASRAPSAVLTHRAALPFAANGLIQIAYNRFDVLFVAGISTAAITAAYAPASRVQDAMLLVAATAGAVTLPTASRLYAKETGSADQSRAVWAKITVVAVTASLALAVVVWFIAPALVPALLGETYRGSVGPIRIIVWSVPIIAFNSVLASVVNARHRPYYVTAAIGAAAVTALTLIVVLVPQHGAEGAAIATTLREVPVAVILLVGAWKTGLFQRQGRPGTSEGYP